MSARTTLSYRAAVHLASAVASVLALRRAKWRRALAGRAQAPSRLMTWARAYRDPSRPLVWIHAPSVGEGLQAEVVLQLLRPRHPDWQIVYTHTSPSAEALAARQPAHVTSYLPWDRARDLEPVLDALRPDALVFSKLDLWPELATRAAARGTAVALIAATVSPVSSRLRWPARSLLRPGYAAVTRAAAIAEDHGERLVRLGVSRERIVVTGDPRFDSALARARAPIPDAIPPGFHTNAPTLVAGSTWPADEDTLLEAFVLVRRNVPSARLILAPHEPTEEHLRAVERRAAALRVPSPARLGAASADSPFVLVDRIGVLAALYAFGEIAYVGGGLGHDGLHSVLEPAACGIPVLFGPHWQDSREAGLLLEANAARIIEANATSMAAAWGDWIDSEDDRRAAGRRALRVVEQGQGAAERNAALVEGLVPEKARGKRVSTAGG